MPIVAPSAPGISVDEPWSATGNPPDSLLAGRERNQEERAKAPPRSAGEGTPTPLHAPDKSLQFALAAAAPGNQGLIRCEERFPATGHHSVLYAVVERKTPEVESYLTRLHRSIFGSDQQDVLAPVHLQIVERAADEAVRNLVEAGLVRMTARISRPVWPLTASGRPARRLSAAEIRQTDAYRRQAAHQTKVARALISAGLVSEARSALLDAMHAIGRALAMEQRLPEPVTLCESLLPPFAACWGMALPLFSRFATEAAEPSDSVVDALVRFCNAPGADIS